MSGDVIYARLDEAIADTRDLGLLCCGRALIAAGQLRLLLLRIHHGLPAGRDSIANLVRLAEPPAREGAE